jgi:hypothetical protein
MNLRETILAEHSKAQTNKIIRWVGQSQQRFDELLQLFLKDEYRVTQRAGWPLSYIGRKYPALVHKHLKKLINNLQKKDLHDAVKRNTVRLFEHIPILEKYHGDIMTICFDFIQSPEETVAVKAFSLAILGKLLPLYPDIANELKLVIEERWEHETAAFHSRARKILKALTPQ